jgi:UDP-glucose 4-epimerase
MAQGTDTHTTLSPTIMKKVLITGSSGYIGQHLVNLLCEDYSLYGIDILPRKNIDLMIGDIRNLSRMHHHYDTVIHLAALVNVGESVSRPWDYYSTNLCGTKNILSNVNYDHFIFASTGAAGQPSSPYGVSKRAAEDVVIEHCMNHHKSFTVFRFFNVIGQSGFEPTNPDGLFFNLIRARESGIFHIYGADYDTPDGTCIRDYVHVMEICHAIKQAIDRPSNSIENLGHGQGHSVRSIVELFKKINSLDFDVIDCPKRLGDLPVSVLQNPSDYMPKLYTIEDLLKL